jgi:hypothetical protein
MVSLLLSNFSELGVEAPTMLTTLLDGLLWRARKTVQGQHFDAFCVLGKHVTCKSPWCVDEIWHARHFTLLLDLDCIARLYTRRSWLERSSCDSMAGFRSLCLYMFVCWNSVLTILIGTRRVNYYVKTLGLYWHRTWNSGVAACWAACWAACFRGALCRMLKLLITAGSSVGR